MTDRLLNEHETAEQLGISVNTLRTWRRQARGPRWIKLGRTVRYKPADLDQWLKANTHP